MQIEMERIHSTVHDAIQALNFFIMRRDVIVVNPSPAASQGLHQKSHSNRGLCTSDEIIVSLNNLLKLRD